MPILKTSSPEFSGQKLISFVSSEIVLDAHKPEDTRSSDPIMTCKVQKATLSSEVPSVVSSIDETVHYIVYHNN